MWARYKLEKENKMSDEFNDFFSGKPQPPRIDLSPRE